MENKTAINKLKKLLFEISNKNDVLNKENTELNEKIISLIKVLKIKDHKLVQNYQKLISINLKNLINKKHFKEKMQLEHYFNKFKNILYENRNCLKINNINNENKKNLSEIGVGDFKINLKYCIRKISCLTILRKKKRNNNNNNQCFDNKDNSNIINFTLNEETINNIYIQGKNIIKPKNKELNLDFSVYQLKILSQENEIKTFNNKNLQVDNKINCFSIIENNVIKIDEKQKEILDLKNIIIEKEKIIDDLNLFNNQNNSEFQSLSENFTQLYNELTLIKNENNNYKIITKDLNIIKNKNLEYEKEIISLNDYINNKKTKINKYKIIEFNIISNGKNNDKRKSEFTIENEISSFNIISSSNNNNKIKFEFKIIKSSNINILREIKENFSKNFLMINENSRIQNIESFYITPPTKKEINLEISNFYYYISNTKEKKCINNTFSSEKIDIVTNNSIVNYFGIKSLESIIKPLTISSKNIIINYINKKHLKKPLIIEKRNNIINYLAIKSKPNNFSPQIIKIEKVSNYSLINKRYIFKNLYIQDQQPTIFFMRKNKLSKIPNLDFYNQLEINPIIILTYHGNNKSKEIINELESSLSSFNQKNILLKTIIFNLKISSSLNKKQKYLFFLKFQKIFHMKKTKISFQIFRNLLRSQKLKTIIKINQLLQYKNFFNNYYLIKYFYKSLYLSLIEKNNLLSSSQNENVILQEKINEFQNTFKLYEQSNRKEKNEQKALITKNQEIISKLNLELSNTKTLYEKMKKTAYDSAQELIKTSNENDDCRKTIEKLNEQLNTISLEKKFNENKLKTQQELIKNLNEKLQNYEKENEQNEQSINAHIEKVQTQFDEYENSIKNLNQQISDLKRDNEKLAVSNLNFDKDNKELLNIIKDNKNYQIENEKIINENENLIKENDELNDKYNLLKKDFDNLKILSEESKGELSKAMSEMELYSQLLQTFENKIKEAENEKVLAQNERDNAINEVKEIRKRYLNIMGEKYNIDN